MHLPSAFVFSLGGGPSSPNETFADSFPAPRPAFCRAPEIPRTTAHFGRHRATAPARESRPLRRRGEAQGEAEAWATGVAWLGPHERLVVFCSSSLFSPPPPFPLCFFIKKENWTQSNLVFLFGFPLKPVKEGTRRKRHTHI